MWAEPRSRSSLRLCAKPIVVGDRDVVELIDSDEAVVEGCGPVGFESVAESGMGTDKSFVFRAKELAYGYYCAGAVWTILRARHGAEVPAGLDLPVSPEAVGSEGFIAEAGANGALGNDDDGLLDVLIVEFVKRDVHKGATLATGGRGFDQQILLAALLVDALLHRAHAELVDARGAPGVGGGDGDGRNGNSTHAVTFFARLAVLVRVPEVAVIFAYISKSFSEAFGVMAKTAADVNTF